MIHTGFSHVIEGGGGLGSSPRKYFSDFWKIVMVLTTRLSIYIITIEATFSSELLLLNALDPT